MNDPIANLKPGRVPDNQRVSLEALLKANGFTTVECRQASSTVAHENDMKARFGQLETGEKKFDGSTVNPQKRRTLRAELEPVVGRR